MKKLLLLSGLAVALAVGWWLGSPLFLDREVAEAAPSAATVEQLGSGQFRDQDAIHKGTGTATLLQDGDELIVRFEEGFETTNGPDLQVLVTPASEIADSDALEAAGWTTLGSLKGNIGSQNYTLPAGVTADQVGSIVIWCRAFDVVFSVASIRQL